jgi:hypothetical protein
LCTHFSLSFLQIFSNHKRTQNSLINSLRKIGHPYIYIVLEENKVFFNSSSLFDQGRTLGESFRSNIHLLIVSFHIFSTLLLKSFVKILVLMKLDYMFESWKFLLVHVDIWCELHKPWISCCFHACRHHINTCMILVGSCFQSSKHVLNHTSLWTW